MNPLDRASEEQLGILIVEGQRCEVWIRSQADGHGTWHNAVLFRRDGKLGPTGPLVAGLEWHLPPDAALHRARQLGDQERLELYRRALRPRKPLA